MKLHEILINGLASYILLCALFSLVIILAGVWHYKHQFKESYVTREITRQVYFRLAVLYNIVFSGSFLIKRLNVISIALILYIIFIVIILIFGGGAIVGYVQDNIQKYAEPYKLWDDENKILKSKYKK